MAHKRLQTTAVNKQLFAAQAEDAGERLDKWLSERSGLTRSAVQTLCGEGQITVSGAVVSKNYRLRGNEEIVLVLPQPKPLTLEAQNIPLEIAYEDDDLLVVNKPKGMVVHPAPGNPDNTLVNALLFHCGESLSGINGVIRPGIVHRLDKDTSGLLIVAKNDFAHTELAQQIKAHSFTRIYNAVVHGVLKQDSGSIDAPIGRNPADRKKMCVTEKNARFARTHYQVKERFDRFTWLELKLETGRTHQIRVHMAHIGFPVAGDTVYGPKKAVAQLHGQCLHARAIGFVHPRTGEALYFESELPAYFTAFLRGLRGGAIE